MDTPNILLEERLWAPDLLLAGTVADWDHLVQYLVGRLSAAIGQPVRVNRVKELLHERAVCEEITQATPPRDALPLQWTGIFSISVPRVPPPEELEVRVSANLFLFVRGERVVQVSGKGDFLRFRYLRGKDGIGNWDDGRWTEDEYGEWESEELPTEKPAGER